MMRTLLLVYSLIIAGAAAGAQGPLAPAEDTAPLLRVPIPRDPGAVRTGDPADSLYRLARAALSDGDFKRAAMLFATVADRYPDSEFAPDALYYRAWALSRGGSSRELELAVLALDRQAMRYPKAGTLNDAKQLRAGIRSEQARRGDPNAGVEISSGAQTLGNEKRCPTEDDDVRLTALTGLVQNDGDQFIPVLKKVLARRDTCSVSLRRRAVYLVAQTKDDERSDILLWVAGSDSSADVRREAVRYLADVNTERAARALDSILFSATDTDMRERALYALAQHRSPSARLSLRRFAELSSVPTELRAKAIHYIGQGRRTGDESEYLRTLFAKTVSPDLREVVIQAFANQKTADRTTWLLGVARDRNQELGPRKKALFHAGHGMVELKELLGLYDELSGQPEMQEVMLYVYAQRKEPEITDKLIHIARTEKSLELRKKAVQWVGGRKEPHARQFVIDLLKY